MANNLSSFSVTSRNGVGKSNPFFIIRMVPLCSITNSRLLPSLALTAPTGASSPEQISINDILYEMGFSFFTSEPAQARKSKNAIEISFILKKSVFESKLNKARTTLLFVFNYFRTFVDWSFDQQHKTKIHE